MVILPENRNDTHFEVGQKIKIYDNNLGVFHDAKITESAFPALEVLLANEHTWVLGINRPEVLKISEFQELAADAQARRTWIDAVCSFGYSRMNWKKFESAFA